MTSFFFNRHQSESPSSFHQSRVRLSESSFNQNIMIRQKFPPTFKQQLWDEISSYEPHKFIEKQNKILEMLLNNEEKFHLLFKQFYENHKKIYDWFMLANQKHLEIKQYVFSKLLQKSILQYKSQLRQNLANKTKKSLKKDENLNQSKLFGFNQKKSPINQSNKLQKIQSLPNSFHKSTIFPIQQRNPCENYYELFMRTLDACQGSKYIHYDFRKHQKGYENRNFYNNFIRSKNTDKQNVNQDQFYQSFKGFQKTKSSFHQKLPSKMFSVIQHNDSKNPTNHTSFSNFQMVTFEDEYDSFQNNEKQKQILGKKGSKKLVLKKMPHRFGNQKPASDFVIKTQKPMSKNK